MINWGEVPTGAVLPFPFGSYAVADGASITLTGLAITDVEIYKGTSMTQRASDAGVVLMDTDGIDVDGITGIHGFSIDTGDNTDAGFYAVGSYFWVVVASVTVDGETVNYVAGTFRLKAAEHTTGYVVATIKDGTGTGEIDTTSGGVLVAAIAANAITASAIATNAIDDDALAADAVTAIQSGLATSAALATVDSIVDDILLDTAEIGAAGAGLTNINLPNQTMDIVGNITGNLSGSVGSVTGAVGSVAAEVTANMTKISGSTTAADNLEESTEVIGTGTCDAGSSTTSIVASAVAPASAVNDQFNGRILIFKGNVTAALAGQASDITDYVHATLTFTCTALTTAPASGDLFVIV